MTGNKNYCVRHEFSESAIYRDALGMSAPLLAFADTGYCIDAPDTMPNGCHAARSCDSVAFRGDDGNY